LSSSVDEESEISPGFQKYIMKSEKKSGEYWNMFHCSFRTTKTEIYGGWEGTWVIFFVVEGIQHYLEETKY